MANTNGFNWRYLIPGYGLILIKKSETGSKKFFYGLNILIIIIIIAIFNNSGQNSNAISNQNNEQQKHMKIGDTIKTGKFDLIVSSVTNRNTVGNTYMIEKAAGGAVFVLVNFNYKNITPKPISSFSIPSIKILDPNGVKYDEASGATSAYQSEVNIDKKLVSDINPGITQRDAVVFEVSNELWKNNGWKLLISGDEDTELLIK